MSYIFDIGRKLPKALRKQKVFTIYRHLDHPLRGLSKPPSAAGVYRKMCDIWRHLLLVNDVIHDVRRCNVVFTLERRYKYMLTYATWSNIGGSSSVQRWKVGRSWRLQICFRRLLCIKIEIDQLQCVICCVLSIYDMIISHALEKQNQNGKNSKESYFSNLYTLASARKPVNMTI